MILKRGLLIWAGLFILAFVNGAIREIGIRRFIDEPWAHHLSALTAVLIFSVYVSLAWGWTRISTFGEAVAVGGLWLVLTVLTETFVINRWMSKLSWERILQSYDLTRGELWPLVLLWVGALPLVMRAIKGPASS